MSKVGKNCPAIAPSSDNFASNVVEEWGSGGVAFLVIPSLLVGISFAIFCEEVYYVMLKSNSKMLRNALLWIMSTYPAITLMSLVGLFVPRAVVEVGFMYNIYEAYAIYKYYYLIIVFAGGTTPFVEKSSAVDVRPNAVPCPCLVCLPPIRNSSRVTETVKWLILQYVIITPLCGAIAVVLRADGQYYKLKGISPSVFISLISAISTLISIYGLKLLFKFTMAIEVIYNYTVIYQIFFLGILARHFYRRSQDIQRQVVLHDDLTLAVDYSGQSCLATGSSLRSAREYDGVIIEGVQTFGSTDTSTHIRFNSQTQAATVAVANQDSDAFSNAGYPSTFSSKIPEEVR